MARLPIQLPLERMQTLWKSVIDPVLINPMTNPGILEGVKLITGDNTVNHKLGRQMQGWFITDIDSNAVVYRSQPMNNLTLTLTSSAPCTINLAVF